MSRLPAPPLLLPAMGSPSEQGAKRKPSRHKLASWAREWVFRKKSGLALSLRAVAARGKEWEARRGPLRKLCGYPFVAA